MPNAAREQISAAVQLFPLLRQCPRETLSPLNDYTPTAFNYNKGIVTLVELLLGKPSNVVQNLFSFLRKKKLKPIMYLSLNR